MSPSAGRNDCGDPEIFYADNQVALNTKLKNSLTNFSFINPIAS
jgi:hypothetical protein